MNTKAVLLTIASLIALSGNANAQKATCSKAAKVAESLMQARQKGVSLQNAMDAMISSYPKTAHKYVRILVMDAYSSPRYHSEEMQQRAIDDFRDKSHLSCLKSGLN